MSGESQELRRAGLKVTLPRVKILQILENSPQRHMTAEDVYRALIEAGEDVGIATVYRVLTQFESAGLVVRHNFDSGPAVYEIDQGEHHDHMVCMETGEVIEFHSPEIERLQEEVAAQHGYRVVAHSLVLYVKPLKKGDKAAGKARSTGED
ncbi:MAG: ferric uptake regulation protein [Porticoccaceae bacterium]|nr:MAG: ferric uptake regulation protein [Porticoccaceae bacterium]